MLPSYTKGEEIFNMVTHICVGAALGVVAIVLLAIFSAIHHKRIWNNKWSNFRSINDCFIYYV